MSVLINGMKMPKDCEACPFWEGLVNGCPITHYFTIRRKGVDRPEWCPLIPVPDHGDLIDRDALYDDDSWEWFNEWGSTVNQQARLVADAPVVIPAERSEASLCDNCDQRNDKGCCVCKYIKERSEDGET